MNIVDTNGITYLLENNHIIQEHYYLVPDVVEEVELTQLIFGTRLPSQILKISEHNLFDESTYLKRYQEILNKYEGRSFYNMTGFGDVSILATIHTIMDIFEFQNQTQLFSTSEQIVVYTDDDGLTKKIGLEFGGKDVIVKKVHELI